MNEKLHTITKKYLNRKPLSVDEKIDFFTNQEHPGVKNVLMEDLAKKYQAR
ncbi:hypothetical protein HC823_01150 [Candidatus Gracilibacteria bacterium]|nr:hypothetical protein [Candidatus Gracilibacteria bacterium]